MTIIVGLEFEGRVWMGGDAGAVGGDTITRLAHPKVFERSGILIGHSSTFRLGNLLRYAGASFPEIPEDAEVCQWAATEFMDAVRDILKTGGHAMKENERESGGFLLVGIRGKLLEINPDYGYVDSADGYLAIGSGTPFALGSLATTQELYMTPEARIRLALEATVKHCNTTLAPFTVLSR